MPPLPGHLSCFKKITTALFIVSFLHKYRMSDFYLDTAVTKDLGVMEEYSSVSSDMMGIVVLFKRKVENKFNEKRKKREKGRH